MNDPRQIAAALEAAKTIAVVGCSPDPARPSHSVATYLMKAGYRVIPVNPGHRTLLGETCYPSILEIPPGVRLDIVDVFRRSSEVGKVADQAIVRGAGFFFMQLGVVDVEAARRLEAAGIPVAMDRCILIERGRLLPLAAGEARGEGDTA
ncbi:MAG TPA: CoA-binding protein [Thermoanaerobaculia bacterium]|nr:CoA-binding protein [Thermoanaerobaculia bacterium]